MSKYQSKKVIVDGITFDSRKEANRYKELSLLERAGAISDLQRQVKYQLLPAQYSPVFDKKARKWKQRCVEREVSYLADFVYQQDGTTVVEDVKGFKTKDYILKRKMMRYFHGVEIKEI